ncbi:unnamed protein product, partial [marine sediment metagenome]
MIGTNLEVFRRFGRAEAFALQCFPCWPGNPGVYTPLEELPAESRLLYDYNPDLAMDMLATEGYPDGFEMDFYCTTDTESMDFAALLQNEWAKIGVTVNIVAHDYVTYRMYRDTFTYTDSIICGTQIGNATGSILNLFKTGGWLNYSQYSNERIDELCVLIAAELDPDVQDSYIKEAGVIALNEVSNIGTYLIPQGYYWWPWVKNYYGEVSITDGGFGELIPYIWIDQDLKA